MALTGTTTITKGPLTFGSKRFVEVAIDITEYAATGYTVVPKDCGLSTVDTVFGGGVSDMGFMLQYNHATGKIQAFGQTPTSATANTIAFVEEEGATDVGAARFYVIGS